MRLMLRFVLQAALLLVIMQIPKVFILPVLQVVYWLWAELLRMLEAKFLITVQMVILRPFMCRTPTQLKSAFLVKLNPTEEMVFI